MPEAIYLTADRISLGTGGGHVTTNELAALQTLFPQARAIGGQELAPFLESLPSSPFLADHFALEMLCQDTASTVRLAHIYSGTFSTCISWLKRAGAVVTYTCPAHDVSVSREEHQRLKVPYPYPHFTEPKLWEAFIRGHREADVVVCPSRLAAIYMEAQGCRRVEIIPHGCSWPEKVAPLPQQFTVGFLSQPGPDKGVTYLFSAWAKLNYRDSTLLLGGPGTEALGSAIQRNVNGGQFRLLGYVPNPSDFYASISVLCAPTVVESFGISVLEAMAHCRAVIVSQGAGASELVEDGVTGFVVPIRAPEAIAERIQWLRARPYKLREMGRKARERAAGFTWEKIGQRYQQLWKSLL